MTKQERTPEELREIQEALTEAATAQTFFFDALRDLEQTIGEEDIDGLDDLDLENQTVESILAMAEDRDEESE